MTPEPAARPPRFHQRHPNLAATLAGLVLVLLLLAAMEGIAQILLLRRNLANPPVLRKMPGLSRDDALLGYAPTPGFQGRATKGNGITEIYAVDLHIDQKGRRESPLRSPGSRSQFALFFGCSFTFGEGVEDGETLPAQFGNHAPEFQPYNYGMVGYGPQNAYLHLLRPQLRDEIPQSSGIALYTYIDAHLARLIGTMRIVTGWGRRLPCLAWDGSERFTLLGTFEQARPLRQRWYRLLASSATLTLLDFDTPPCNRDRDLEFVAALCAAQQQLLHDRFPDARFYVHFFPRGSTTENRSRLKTMLEKRKVPILDLSAIFDAPGTPSNLTLADGHPNAAAYALVAQALAERLRSFPAP